MVRRVRDHPAGDDRVASGDVSVSADFLRGMVAGAILTLALLSSAVSFLRERAAQRDLERRLPPFR